MSNFTRISLFNKKGELIGQSHLQLPLVKDVNKWLNENAPVATDKVYSSFPDGCNYWHTMKNGFYRAQPESNG